MVTSADVVIVGGGVTGLAVARLLGVDGRLFERDAQLGGCLRSDRVGGYTIDRTGHLLHFQDPYVQQVMYRELSLDWIHFDRRAEVWMLGSKVPYPVQYNLHALPADARDLCLQSFIASGGNTAGLNASFEQWSRSAYGDELHELFFGPYNRKLWQVPLDTMSAEWTSRFVPLPDRELILQGARGPHSATDFGYNARFSYPRDGGSGAIIDGLTSQISMPIETGVELLSVDADAQFCEFSNGARVRYDRLVSTIPLPQLVKLIHNVDAEILELSRGLRHNSIVYFAFGFRIKTAAPAPHWIYVPEETFAMYRIGILSNYSPHVAPEGSILVCAEIGCSPADLASMDLAALRTRALDDIGRLGLSQPDWELELVHQGSIPCAYVIFDEFRRTALARIQSYLNRHGIYSVGRYGAWTYGSMGDALIEGRDCVELIHRELGQISPASP